MKPDETWCLTPHEIVRFAEVRAVYQAERDKLALRLEYLNAALQRAKTMPKFETLVRKNRPVRLSDIVRHFAEAEKKE